MHLPVCLLTRLGQRLEEILPVHIIQKNVLPPVATAHDVVIGPRIFNTDFARHPVDFQAHTGQGKTKLWVDPFLAHRRVKRALDPRGILNPGKFI